ncbi:hypothetical protein BDV93DRAFT_392694, partial [Ceratobasidium sp. AG-I]
IRKINTLTQTKDAVSYTTEFRNIAADLGWDDVGLMDRYDSGLHWKVKELISQREHQPTTLQELINLAIKMDNVRIENEANRPPRNQNRVHTSSSSKENTTPRVSRVPSADTPNFVTHISKIHTRFLLMQEEKDRRRAAGVCMKCGKPGHGWKEC